MKRRLSPLLELEGRHKLGPILKLERMRGLSSILDLRVVGLASRKREYNPSRSWKEGVGFSVS